MVSSLGRTSGIQSALKTLRRHRFSTNPNSEIPVDVSEQLRQVMRNVPQPVAIAVTRKSDPGPSTPYHGATLSSFTSLTLHPHPLVAFSLRLPSKLADYLRSPTPIPSNQPLTISLLSQLHQDIAQRLSKPGLDQSTLFTSSEFDTSEPPGLQDAIGKLRCQVVTSIRLKDMPELSSQDEDVEFDDEVEGAGLIDRGPPQTPKLPISDSGEQQAMVHGSELFICKVIEVEHGSGDSADKPMLYWKQQYTGVQGSEPGSI